MSEIPGDVNRADFNMPEFLRTPITDATSAMAQKETALIDVGIPGKLPKCFVNR
jgi:hypothetical protein